MILIIYRYISGLRQTQSQIPERLLDKHGSQAPDPQFQEKYFFILVLQYIAGCLFVLLLIFSALKKISISPYPGEGLTAAAEHRGINSEGTAVRPPIAFIISSTGFTASQVSSAQQSLH